VKVTKLVHSCLLVETDAGNYLIDPGMYSWDSGVWSSIKQPDLTAILITHDHADHMYTPFLQALVDTHPGIKIHTNHSAAELLSHQGFSTVETTAPNGVSYFTAHHEEILLSERPENVGLHIANELSHPGDSHSFTETKRVLALPLTAPWGSAVNAIKLASTLLPEVIVPIHDWHWRESALLPFYDRLEAHFADQGIRFIKAVNGHTYDI
jgi:L-ascorbate metabolism protein UlaG (beta-lactamase superfamily)